MPRRCSRCRSTKATATMQSGSPASCRPAGSKRCTSRISTADSVRALLASRALLVKIKRDLENYVRGLLKNIGLVIGRAKFNVFAVRAEELIEGRPELIAAIRPLLEARNAVGQQVSELDRKVMKLARHDAQVRRLRSRHLREDLRGCIPPKSQSPRPSDPDGSSRQTRRPLT